ncbi:MAG: anti-sigma factor domain-containing protein [Clostridia bacterium]|nr:anti-sigma factor domain-containing protein [Clostridia bacterium]
MKAVIVEIKNQYAVALDKNGAFIKIRNSGNLKVGNEIDLPAARSVISINSWQKVSSLAAAVLLFLSLGLGVYGYYTPYSYINIDINPSVEITSNIFNRIIRIEALNEDGQKIIKEVVFENKSIEDGVDLILDRAAEEGYLTGEAKNDVLITVSGKSDEKTTEIRKKLEESAKTELQTEKVKAEVMVENVNIQRHDDARKAGVSPGKMLLIERLQEVNPQAKMEEYKNAPVKEIMKHIKEGKKQERYEKKETKDQQGEADSAKTDEKTDSTDANKKTEDKKIEGKDKEDRKEDRNSSKKSDRKDSKSNERDEKQLSEKKQDGQHMDNRKTEQQDKKNSEKIEDDKENNSRDRHESKDKSDKNEKQDKRKNSKKDQ